jgi:hypothetical protein
MHISLYHSFPFVYPNISPLASYISYILCLPVLFMPVHNVYFYILIFSFPFPVPVPQCDLPAVVLYPTKYIWPVCMLLFTVSSFAIKHNSILGWSNLSGLLSEHTYIHLLFDFYGYPPSEICTTQKTSPLAVTQKTVDRTHLDRTLRAWSLEITPELYGNRSSQEFDLKRQKTTGSSACTVAMHILHCLVRPFGRLHAYRQCKKKKESQNRVTNAQHT